MTLQPDQSRLYAIQSGEATDLPARAWRTALSAATPLYRLGLRLDQSRKAKRAVALGRPTLSVGNLTAGGTGKTPMVAALVERLIEMDHRPAVLMRGFAANQGLSDEAALLAAALPAGTPVEPDPDRAAAAQRILQSRPDTTCFVLDDGFQHRQVHRDLDLVLIDATRPFGFGHLLPRGLLREPASALARADAVIVTRSDQISLKDLRALEARIEQPHGKPPIAHAVHAWKDLRSHDEAHHPLDILREVNVLGVAGIGNPEAFRRQLATHVAGITEFIALDDHHTYTPQDLRRIQRRTRDSAASAVVTTEKDWVKMVRLAGSLNPDVPFYRPTVALRFAHGETAWLDQLRRTFTHTIG